jgi:hypothetical protein
MNRFVIVFPGRCGSNMLTRMLALHPDIDIAAYEAFAEEPLARGDRRAIGGDEDGAAFVRELIYVARRPGIQAIGFKLAYHHAPRPPQWTVWDFLGGQDVKVVHLTRQNPLDRLISNELALSQRRWVASERQNGIYDPVPVHIDFESLRENVEWLQRSAARVRSLVPGARRLELTYEELSQQPAEILARSLSFIGVAPRHIMPVTRRQRTFGQREAVANYDRLRATVRRLRPEWDAFFTDG